MATENGPPKHRYFSIQKSKSQSVTPEQLSQCKIDCYSCVLHIPRTKSCFHAMNKFLKRQSNLRRVETCFIKQWRGFFDVIIASFKVYISFRLHMDHWALPSGSNLYHTSIHFLSLFCSVLSFDHNSAHRSCCSQLPWIPHAFVMVDYDSIWRLRLSIDMLIVCFISSTFS